MPTYTAPIRDMEFVLNDVLNVQSASVQGYDELEPDFLSAILTEAGKITSEVLAPLNSVGDKEGCVFENGVVRTPTGFKAAFDQVREGGWTGIDCDPDMAAKACPISWELRSAKCLPARIWPLACIKA